MPVEGPDRRSVMFPRVPFGWDLSPCLLLVATLLLAAPPLSAIPKDPPPAETELRTLPGPENTDPANPESDPFALFPEMPDSIRIENDGSIAFDGEGGTIIYKGSVQVLADNGIQLFADEALLDTRQKFVRLTGNVSIYQGTVLHRGDSATYHYDTRKLDASQLRSSLDPMMLEAGRFHTVDHEGNIVFIGEDAGITTHDEEDPSYWLRAKKTVVIPGDRVIFHDLKVIAGGHTVFWLPYLSQPLDRQLGYHFLPGGRSNWGAFLLNSYGVMIGGEEDPVTGQRDDARILANFHADILSRRGLATGVDFIDTHLDDNPNLGWLKLYYLNDLNPNLERGGQKRESVNEDRWRIQLRQRVNLDLIPGGRTYLDADLTFLSDRYYLEDFDPSTFRTEPAPDNTLAFVHERERTLFTFWTRLRLNDFYQSDERLPEFAIDQVKAPLFGSPIIHEGQTTFGLYRERMPDFARSDLKDEQSLLAPGDSRFMEIDYLLAEHGFARFHTWQEASLPIQIGDWLNLVPKAGIGFTNYSSVQGLGEDTSRPHLFTGIDASTKFSRSYPDIQSDRWGLDGLLHIIQPYASLSFYETNDLPSDFGRIDRLTASTRPRPLAVGRFAAIDDLEDWSILRLGVRNRLLTHRDDSTHEWLSLDTYIDIFLRDPEFGRSVSNLYNDLVFHPVPWLDLSLETQIPFFNTPDDFTEVAGAVRFMPDDDLEIAFRHRYLSNHPILTNSHRIELQTYKRFNEDWGFGLRHQWEFDTGTLESQNYTLHRNLDNWAISFGAFQRTNKVQDEYGFYVGFTLKDFPSFSLPLSIGAE